MPNNELVDIFGRRRRHPEKRIDCAARPVARRRRRRPSVSAMINDAEKNGKKVSGAVIEDPWLDRIAAYFDLSIAAFDNPKVRPIIRQWRNKYADTPRTADMGMQVLSRVCGYAVEQGKLTVNPCDRAVGGRGLPSDVSSGTGMHDAGSDVRARGHPAPDRAGRDRKKRGACARRRDVNDRRQAGMAGLVAKARPCRPELSELTAASNLPCLSAVSRSCGRRNASRPCSSGGHVLRLR